MSTAPPPPPPPPDYSQSYARQRGAWARQAVKQQRRAADLAARQRRDLLRAQKRAQHRTSIVGPALLVLIGMVLFLAQSGHLAWASAFQWLSLWWPLILVASGIVLLVEWGIDARVSAEKGVPLPRRTLGPLGLLALLAVASAGLSVSGLHWGANWARSRWSLPESWGVEDWLQPHRESVQQLTSAFTPGALLVVQNHRGNITITGSSGDGLVHVTARQRTWGWNAKDLDSQQKKSMPRLESTTSGMRLEVAGEGQDVTDLTLEVPHEASLQLEAEQGEVAIHEVRGAVTVLDHRGNVEMTALAGDVQLQMRDDDATVSGHSLTGSVRVEGRSGDLTFTDVAGPLTLKGDFFGTTHLERVQGAAHFETSYTTFDCAGIPGELNVEGRSEMTGRDLNGPVTLVTTDREISLSELRKGVTVQNQKGSVTLSFVALSDHVSARTTDGSIKVRVPASSAFRVRAETADGEIRNDFGLKEQASEESRVSLAGEVKRAGPLLDLQTKDGDIDVLKAEGAETQAESKEP